MVKHMIIWKFRESVADKERTAAEIKQALEGLVGKIEGLEEMHILTAHLPVCSGDLMMDSTFADAAALATYQSHPAHKEVANGIVRPAMEQRLSFDYEV